MQQSNFDKYDKDYDYGSTYKNLGNYTFYLYMHHLIIVHIVHIVNLVIHCLITNYCLFGDYTILSPGM